MYILASMYMSPASCNINMCIAEWGVNYNKQEDLTTSTCRRDSIHVRMYMGGESVLLCCGLEAKVNEWTDALPT